MTPSQLADAILFAIKNNLPLLIKGAPGTGKSDIIAQACEAAGANLIISHPVVSDPTDYKGLPFPVKEGTEATFLPFGDMLSLISADKPTVFFLDDLGQAPASVQAACMQLILARKINNHNVSPHVVFMAATNRREDKAGVMGILEPVKSRFSAILQLDVNTDDWVDWAFKNNMPEELIAFIRYRPKLLHDFKASGDIVNSPCPRTVAYVGKMMKAGIKPDVRFEMFKGAAGEGFAAEFTTFLNIYKKLPDINAIIADPDKAEIPNEPSILFAVCGALVHKAKKDNFGKICQYSYRLPQEFQVLLMKDSVKKSKVLTETPEFATWAIKHADLIL